MPNLSKNLKKDLKKVESLMRKNLSKEPVVKDLYDYIFDKSGKKVRASISLISSYGMNKNQQNRVKLAAIIELLHTATLVHDDIIDNSDLRRGKTTVNVVWSNSHGVLIGDFIYSKAFMLMNEIGNFKVIDELSSATNKIAEGELMQLANKNNLDTSLQQLKKISYYKTGRLFEASAKSAAMLSGKSTSFVENISKAAKLIGIVFQVRDDLLDYGISKGNIGKPEMQDILEDKITYPLYFALKNSSKKDSSKILKKLKNKDFSVEEVADFVSSSNAFNKCNSLIQSYSNEISECINKISNKEIRDEMLNLSESLKNRYE
jgi:octaprenyl-diphosphate synthase